MPTEREKIAEKWAYYRSCRREKRKKLLNHEFAFCIDYVGAGWEYIHFELDGETVDSYRISYIGPTVRSFVDCVTRMKDRDFVDIAFYDEPGEYHQLFSRRQDNIYIKLYGMDDGFFLRYEYFVERVMEGYGKAYG